MRTIKLCSVLFGIVVDDASSHKQDSFTDAWWSACA